MVIISSITLKWVVPLRTTIKQYCIDLNCGYLLTWVISDNPCQNFWYRLLSNISLRWQWQLRVQLTERQLVCKHRGTLTSHHTTAPLPSCSVTLRSSYLSCQPALHWSSPLSPWMNDPPSAAARCSENIARWSKHKHKNMSQVNANPQWPRHHQRQSRVRSESLLKMSFLRGSANYVWCTTSVLGKGATGAVFQVMADLVTSLRLSTNTSLCRESTNTMERRWLSRRLISWATCDHKRSRWENLRFVRVCVAGPSCPIIAFNPSGPGKSETWKHCQTSGHWGGTGGPRKGRASTYLRRSLLTMGRSAGCLMAGHDIWQWRRL